METLNFLRETLGDIYISKQQQDLVYKYSFLLKEKKSIINKINTFLMYEEDSIITLEDWHIDLLQLQSDRILFDSNNNVIEYPNYYSQEQLTIISILKKATYNPDKLINQEIQTLVNFFKNRKLVEDIIASSGNGLKLNKRALKQVMTLFEGYTTTTGRNITIYESLCTQLSLTKKDTHKLEKKIA